MPKKSNHYFHVNCPYVRVGTLVCKRITDIFTKNRFFFVLKCSFRIQKKQQYNGIDFNKEVKKMMLLINGYTL